MKHSHSSIFLMELIIAILFFSLSSAVCIQLFVKSHTLSRDAINQNNAIVHAQNLAETWLAVEGDTDTLISILENCVSLEDDSPALLFDRDWTPVTDSHSADIFYIARLTEGESSDGLLHADITVYELPDRTIYSLPLSHHTPERRGSHE